MAQKTVKKAAVKPAAKKTAVKKTPAKKATVKAAATHECGCGANCECAKKCGCGCGCGANCECAKKCACGCRAGRFVKKLIVVLIIFALGFAAARVCCGCCQKGMKHRAPRMHYVEGCLDVASVKCPKLAAALPAMDINQDGCITREEFRAVKRHMRAEVRDINVEEVESATVAE